MSVTTSASRRFSVSFARAMLDGLRSVLGREPDERLAGAPPRGETG